MGSTEGLIRIVREAPQGSSFAIGTEIHLVNRLAKEFAPQGKKIVTLDDTVALCTTMYRIKPAASGVGAGEPCGRARGESHQVRDDVKYWARVALDRMLEIRT